MKNIFNLIMLFALVFGLNSCKNHVTGFDEDPNGFGDAAPQLTLGKAQLAWSQLYESNGARYASIFCNQMTGSDRQYLTVNTYSTTADDYDDTWDDIYVDGVAQARLVAQKAKETGEKPLEGVAQIIEAGLLGTAASIWGDIPFSEACSEVATPKFDGQVGVYGAIQSLLSDAIANVGDASASFSSGNRMSSTSTWAQIAHSLKARYYLHTGEYANALSEAQLGISSEDGSLVQLHNSSPGSKNLYFVFCVDERGGYLTANGSHLFKLLDASDDVNRILDTPGDTARFKHYFTGNELNTDDGYFAIDASFNIISYNEVKLIEAEAANRTGDDVTAAVALNVVRDNLALKYGTYFPQTTSSGGDLLMEILEEKFITLYGEIEAWNDVKRTKNMLNIPPKVGDKIPQRFLVPQVELDTNPNAVEKGLFESTPVNQ